MQAIATHCPELIPDYLVDNWRTQIAKIIDDYNQNQIVMEEGTPLLVAISKTQQMIEKLKEIEFKLESVLTPVHKRNLHEELIDLFRAMRHSFQDMLNAIEKNDQKNLQLALNKHQENSIAMQEFTKKYLMSEV